MFHRDKGSIFCSAHQNYWSNILDKWKTSKGIKPCLFISILICPGNGLYKKWNAVWRVARSGKAWVAYTRAQPKAIKKTSIVVDKYCRLVIPVHGIWGRCTWVLGQCVCHGERLSIFSLNKREVIKGHGAIKYFNKKVLEKIWGHLWIAYCL